jgi:hypothetical protein
MIAQVKDAVLVTRYLKRGGRSNDVSRGTSHIDSNQLIAAGIFMLRAVESASSLLKRGIMGTWHRISPKHLASYLEEMEFRFNRRKRADLFIDTLRHMVTAPTLTFEKLTA